MQQSHNNCVVNLCTSMSGGNVKMYKLQIKDYYQTCKKNSTSNDTRDQNIKVNKKHLQNLIFR